MNKIIRALILGGQVSLSILQTTEMVSDAIKIHSPTENGARVLGGLLTCGAYLAAGLKEGDAGVSLTVKAKQGDGAVCVSSDGKLNVRGYVDGTCAQTLCGGTLTVVREEEGRLPFVGTCEISSDDVSEILSIYFQQSEQIPTVVDLSVRMENGVCSFAGGVIMQLLPEASEGAIERAAELFEEYKSKKQTLTQAEDVLHEIFGGVIYGEPYTLQPRYKCNCSRQKIERILLSVGRDELLKICAEQGKVNVHCHYCNTDYDFNPEDIEKLFPQ